MLENTGVEWSPIYETEVAEVLRTTLNWEAPGRDQTATFWLKELTEIEAYSATLFNKLIEESQVLDWLTTEVTNHFRRMKTLKDQRITER